MKKVYRLIVVQFLIGSSVFAQNVGINTDGSDPNGDAILHIKNHSGASTDSSVVRIENEQNGANDVTGLEIYNSGTGNTARWDVYIPASGSTDLRIKNNGSDHVTIQNDGDVGIGTTSPLSGLDVQTSLGYAVTTITSATTLDNTHNVVLCNTGPYTVTLPAASSNTGKVYYIKNIDADGDYFTIDGYGSETIEGNTTFTLNIFGHAVRIISDGSNWHALDEVGKNNTEHCGEYFEFTWNPVTNPETGRTWMDRNLGAKRVATAFNDEEAYGDYYQWGRAADGHQCRNSGTTSSLSTTDVPGHGDFIITSGSPDDWRSGQNANLWQGVNGTNNPCPSGYRLPTEAECNEERLTWPTNNGQGAFNSVLRFTTAGRREQTGVFCEEGTYAFYWSSTVSGVNTRFLHWHKTAWTSIWTYNRADGMPVRCIKD